MVNDNKKNGALLPVSTVAKELGIPKTGVQALVDDGKLSAFNIAGKSYITRMSIYEFLGVPPVEERNFQIPEKSDGYLSPEELSSVLTKSEIGQQDITKAGANDMSVYKGSISTLKDGRFMVQIDLGKDENGDRKRESKSFRSKMDAQDYLNKRLYELNGVLPQQAMQPVQTIRTLANGEQIEDDIIYKGYTTLTFEEYALDVLNQKIGLTKTRTLEGYRGGLQPIAKIIGKMPMVAITRKDINRVFANLCPMYVQSNIERSYKIMKLIMEQAYDDGDIPINPMRKMDCPKSSKNVEIDKREKVYSADDISVLFRTSKEYNIELYTMFAVLECTGMRPGELRALEWECFNPIEKTISIEHAATFEYEDFKTLMKKPNGRAIISTPKSASGIRTIRLSDLAVEALLEWKEYKSRSRNRDKATSKYIFSNREGSFKSETACKSMLQRYKAKYDVEDIGVTFYKFRHTMCTRLILSGQPDEVTKKVLGDVSGEMMKKVYGHINDNMALEATRQFYDNLNQQHNTFDTVI